MADLDAELGAAFDNATSGTPVVDTGTNVLIQ
jgi:hypothetical protein